MALDGTLDKFNSKNMSEAGPLDLIDTTGEASDLEDRIDNTLPGATRGDASARKVRPAIRTTGIRFSPTNRSFAAACTEGLLVYAVDDVLLFDPFDLDIDITVDNTREKLYKEKEYMTALVMAFRLGERKLIHEVYEAIPMGDIDLIARELPEVYLPRLMNFISSITTEEDSPHVEFHLLWIRSLLAGHGRYISTNRRDFAPALRGIQKFATRLNKEINGLADSNIYTVEFLLDHNKPENGDQLMDIDSDQKPENESDDSSDDDEDYDSEEWLGPQDSKTNGVQKADKMIESDEEY